ncbi:MAG TPA: nucleotidyltransferase domain-containing protein [Terriglobales bacterium]|jgi:predicted nucleotidyltransferase|nr:nucleotidyltransferase domain-containing protein [Terriglobales bacterium]
MGGEPPSKTTRDLLNSNVLRVVREGTHKKRKDLDSILSSKLGEYASPDTSLVVFGSLAREEWTSGSDLDWTFLIDGSANPDHLQITQDFQRVFKDNKYVEPGPTGTFGNMAFSHDIIHQIGGQNDTNKNTTQRILLLLESVVIGKRTDAYERVIRGVIDRYLDEDNNYLLMRDYQRFRVPRFLLNDIVRFWRTMAVDFASKQRDRGGAGWGLRNAKLRMSRKLIFASGLLVCFDAHLNQDLRSQISTDKSDIKLKLLQHIRNQVQLTPLEILAKSIERYGVSDSIAQDLFGSYAEFLTVLNDESSREALKNLRAENSRTDRTFQRIREISGTFKNALDHIFFENKQIAPLTREYGVF